MIKRYDVFGYEWEIDESRLGEWVKYDDVVEFILMLIDAFDDSDYHLIRNVEKHFTVN